MGRRKTVSGLAIAGLAVWLFAGTKNHEAVAPVAVHEPQIVEVPEPEAPAQVYVDEPTPRSWRRRAATTLAFTALFFAGAALSAGAGNELAHVDAGSTDPVTDVTTTDAADTTDAATTATDEVATTDTDAVATTATDDTATTETTTEPDPSDATPVTTTATVETTETTDTTAAAPVLPTTTPDDGAVTPAAPAAETDAVATPAAPVVQHTAAPAAPPAPAPATANAPAATPAAGPVPMQPATSPFPVIAFDPQAWLIDHPGTPVGNAAVAIAERYIGVPYVWGGNKPSTGFDCSGLTQFVYAQLGVWLPHYAAAQFLAYQRLDPSQLQAGDLVFFEPKADGPGHVAIYAGGDRIVEAPHTGATVRIGSLSGAAAALGFLGAVRPTSAALPVVRRVAAAVAKRATFGGAPGAPGAFVR